MNWEKYYIEQANSSFERPFPFSNHYTSQIGGGPFYTGVRKQQGYGLGGLLSKLGRFVLPLIKPVAKSIGKQVLKSGAQFAGEILAGEDPKQSFKRNLKQGAKALFVKGKKNIQKKAASRRGVKRKNNTQPRNISKLKRLKTQDIFNS